LLVAWTPRGVCEVSFGDHASEPVAALRTRFAGARLARADVPDWVNRVIAAVEQPSPADVPLDVRGTAFQQRVWEALRRIPLGQTRTYAQLAAELGAPRAARAVARACASNRLAVVVPCHRVIRGDGSLSGYRWRPARKRELLRREAERRGARASPLPRQERSRFRPVGTRLGRQLKLKSASRSPLRLASGCRAAGPNARRRSSTSTATPSCPACCARASARR
jgi:AraC family transcriptional regulator of adaptative response/methylated-DNA-[protein]-cysteine methyltransferase